MRRHERGGGQTTQRRRFWSVFSEEARPKIRRIRTTIRWIRTVISRIRTITRRIRTNTSRRYEASILRRDGGSRSGVLTEGRLAACYFVSLALLVLYPLLAPGYVLTLDMVFSPNANYTAFAFRDKGPLYYGRLPFTLLLDALSLVVADWVLQKAILLSIIAGGGYAMYRTVPVRSPAAKLFAGTLFALNPFVYVRLLAGHWYFMLGYAALPLAIGAVYAHLTADRPGARSRWRAIGWTTVVAIFDPHAAVLLAIAFVPIVSLSYLSVADRRSFTTRLFRLGALVVAVNAYWLVPALATLLDRSTKLSAISSLDLVAFGARGTVDGNVPLSVAMLYGFWRGGDRLPIDVLPRWVVFACFGFLLFLVIYGWASRLNDPLASGLALAAVLSFLLAIGVRAGTTGPYFRLLFEHVPVLRGMRDTQKFVGLIALSYAYLGGIGLDALLREIRSERTPHLGRSADGWRTGQLRGGRGWPVHRRTVVALVLVLLALSTPFAYTVTALGGLGGQVEPVTYPEEWHEANDYLGDDPSSRVLFLPWHQYLDFTWTDRRVANPSDVFFEKPVIRGQNIEIAGIESQSTTPAHLAVEEVLADSAERTDFGARIAPIGVEYVILAKEVDHHRYGYLEDQDDLSLVLENERLLVYRNDAFDSKTSPHAFPSASKPTPHFAILVGSVISLFVVLGGVVDSFQRSGRNR